MKVSGCNKTVHPRITQMIGRWNCWITPLDIVLPYSLISKISEDSLQNLEEYCNLVPIDTTRISAQAIRNVYFHFLIARSLTIV